MQTFLPYPDFRRTAACLDNRRLGKQRVEVLQILNVLTGVRTGWRTHPAVLMWRGHEHALALYGVAICEEWTSRGFRDTCRTKIMDVAGLADPLPALGDVTLPGWLGNEEFHASHRAHLVRKDADHYLPALGGSVEDVELVWPVTAP